VEGLTSFVCGSTGIIATTDAIEACKGINIAVIVAGYSDNMERKDTLHENALLLKAHASALEHAAPDCQVRYRVNRLHSVHAILFFPFSSLFFSIKKLYKLYSEVLSNNLNFF